MQNPLLFPRFACTLSAFVLWAAVAGGQEDPEQQEQRGRQAWFVATSIPAGLDNPITVLSGNDPYEITLSKRSVGMPVRIPQDGLLRVVRLVPDPENPEEEIYETLAAARVAEGINQALVFLVPLAARQEDGRIFGASVHDLAGFRGGDYMFLNLTRANVAVQVGDDRIVIQPGRREISRDPGGGEPVNVPISYHFQDPQAGQWRLISASTVFRVGTRREICIFSWDPRYERISYHGITFPVSR